MTQVWADVDAIVNIFFYVKHLKGPGTVVLFGVMDLLSSIFRRYTTDMPPNVELAPKGSARHAESLITCLSVVSCVP